MSAAGLSSSGMKCKIATRMRANGIKFTVIGIVQAQGNNPTDIYVPLKVAQDLPLQADSLKGEVNTIYVTAASSAGIPGVTKEISSLLPGAEVTSESGLASEVTGSVTSAAKLANDLGRWLAALPQGGTRRRAAPTGTSRRYLCLGPGKPGRIPDIPGGCRDDVRADPAAAGKPRRARGMGCQYHQADRLPRQHRARQTHCRHCRVTEPRADHCPGLMAMSAASEMRLLLPPVTV
jgi:hypothetical protein